MPVLFDSSASGTQLIGGVATSGSKSLTHNVSTSARDTVVAFVALVFTGEVNTTSATFTATFGGESMTLVESQTWDTYKGCLHVFKLEDAPRGENTVVAGFTGMPTELISRNFMVISETYSGVDEIASSEEEGGTTATANSVVVTSVRPAHRVASFHGVGKHLKFTAYNKTKRQSVAMLGGGGLLSGDAEGAATVTCTATQGSTDEWAAIGVAMTPSVVEIAASLNMNLTMRASAVTFRIATPHPDREYTVPPPDSDSNLIAGNFVRNPSGVLMPVWLKDTNDTLDYTLHWDHYLADDDAIASVQHYTSGSLRAFSESFEGAMTQVWLNGGTANITHPVRVRLTTEKGRQHDFTFYIAGVEN